VEIKLYWIYSNEVFPARYGHFNGSLCAIMRTYGTLFAGGGFTDAGLNMAGFTPRWAIELDPAIAAVHRQNLGDHVTVGDVTLIDPSTLEPVDLLWASPPCQAYSIARDSSLPERADKDAGKSVIRFVDALNPKLVVIENVEGFLGSPVCNWLIEELWAHGYWVDAAIYSAADFGVPQSRRRAIIRAKRGAMVPQLLPTRRKHKGWYQAVADLLPRCAEKALAPWQEKLLPELIGGSIFAEVHNCKRMASTRTVDEPATTVSCASASRPSHTLAVLLDGSPASNGERLPIRTDRQAGFTVTATQDHRPFKAVTEGRVVQLSTRCLARLQTLPDWYVLPERRSLASKIIGNGVPCLFAKAIAESMGEVT
jgi:DNA (cytosine-5)-methyltransferase 1